MGPRSTWASARSRPGRSSTSRLAAKTGQSQSIPSSNNNISNTVDTSVETEDTTASLKQKTLTMALKVMRCEERNMFFGDLIKARLGTKEVENFIYNQEYLRSISVAVLRRGPKFCCRRILSKERYLIEMEKCYCKIRWEERDKDPEERKKQKEESKEERKERKRVEDLVFDQDTMEMDYRKRRATACKNNTAVILPGPLTPAQEQEIECRRVLHSG